MTAITSAFLCTLYYMIFYFSAQDAEASGSLSQMISVKCVESINFLIGRRWEDAVLSEIAGVIEHPIRKLAHFSEYGVMGILVHMLLSQWMRQGRRLRLFVASWVFLSASCDEFHQYFVPGRYASIADVAIDTCGGVCGMLFCVCVAAMYKKHRMAKAGRKRGRRKE